MRKDTERSNGVSVPGTISGFVWRDRGVPRRTSE